uniref:Fibrinogen C-terminal domain-containing protein n=1 Tax=Anopheles maculatus TaxID=74869 RepID=A0A182S5Z9_9DIPT
MQSLRNLTITQQRLVTKTFLTESLLALEKRYEGSNPQVPEGDVVYTSCDDERITQTGTYLVQDAFDEPIKLLCVLDFQPGAYTVIQNRQDGSTDFYRGYSDYRSGFGEFDSGDYWLGLDRIHNITASGDYELFIQLEDFEKNVTYARYDSFEIGTGNDFYPITKLSGYSGSAGDSYGSVVGVLFSAYDLDLDNSESNCAASYRGAWWYRDCGLSNLNGLYLKGLSGGMFWETFRGPFYSLKKSRMMVKRKSMVTTTTSMATESTATTTVIATESTATTTVTATESTATTTVTATESTATTTAMGGETTVTTTAMSTETSPTSTEPAQTTFTTTTVFTTTSASGASPTTSMPPQTTPTSTTNSESSSTTITASQTTTTIAETPTTTTIAPETSSMTTTTSEIPTTSPMTTEVTQSTIVMTSCDDNRITQTGTYLVQDAFAEPIKLLCVLDFQPGAYTVIQNRQDGSTDFYRGYSDYRSGFGTFDGGDYWLGLDRIHNITASGDYELFIQLEDFENNVTYARYENFAIGAGNNFYPITKMNGYSGSAGDSYGSVVGVLFSAYDLDLDNSESNCAVSNGGAWWYTDCGLSNLNGMYLNGLSDQTTGMFWETFRGVYYSLKKSRMMVKRKQTGTTTVSSATTPSTTAMTPINGMTAPPTATPTQP